MTTDKASITSEQTEHFQRLLVDIARRAAPIILKRVSPDREGLQHVLEAGDDFANPVIDAMIPIVRRQSAAQPDYGIARAILGDDFLTPEEIATTRRLVYTDEQLAQAAETLPSQEVLEWFRDHNFFLVAGPPSERSLLEVRELKPERFLSQSGGWYAHARETFSRVDKVGPGWIAISKGPIPGSLNLVWEAQQKLLSEREYVPHAAATTWGLTTYEVVRD